MSKLNAAQQLKAEQEAIENCENAVLAAINCIQPFGYLLACSVNNYQVNYVSENSEACFGKPAAQLLQQPLSALLPKQVVHQCRNAAAHSTITHQREHVGRFASNGEEYEVFAHKKNKQLILELQKASSPNAGGSRVLDKILGILQRLKPAESELDLMSLAVEELRALTGFDRVKAYRFLPDGAGEVVAESREPHVDSFLGLRFPAYDIPQAARALYKTTPIRIIPSVEAAAVPIIAASAEAPTLDLSLALFRGCIPVHVLYLKNMGVSATLSLPLVVDGELWGLLAFHHMAPRLLDSEIITAAETLGASISLMLERLLQGFKLKRLEECTRMASSLFAPDESSLGFSAYWDTASTDLATLIPCDGVGLLSEGRFDHYGHCPAPQTVQKLALRLDSAAKQDKPYHSIIAIDSIAAHFPELDCGDTAGVLAVPAPALSYRYLFFFRKDASLVRWAGMPTKDIEKQADGFRLNPRASFNEYTNNTHRRSDAFTNGDIVVAQTLKDSLQRVMSSISTHRQHRERLGLMVRELNHRVRNILALVSSIVAQSQDKSHDIESFILSLEHRIQALSETHKLLSEFDWQPIDIQALFERGLMAYRSELHSRIRLQGANLNIPPTLASLLALVVHELASNATKYGALSTEQGQVTLSWQVNAQQLLVHWQESGGPTVIPPTRHGFGSSLIKEALAYEFDANCELQFTPAGLEAHFSIPHTTTKIEVPPEQLGEPTLKPIRTPLSTRRFSALILEDDYIIAKSMASLLTSLGATRVDTSATLSQAEEYIAHTHYDFALLDANIRGEFSVNIAAQLQHKGVPFAFATGYGSRDQQLRATACLQVLTKPVGENDLLSVLKLAKLIPKA